LEIPNLNFRHKLPQLAYQRLEGVECILWTYFKSANRPLLSNKNQWLIATGMFSERNDIMLDAPSCSYHPAVCWSVSK